MMHTHCTFCVLSTHSPLTFSPIRIISQALFRIPLNSLVVLTLAYVGKLQESTVFAGCSVELSVAFVGGVYIWWRARDEELARNRVVPMGSMQRRREEQAAARGGAFPTDTISTDIMPTDITPLSPIPTAAGGGRDNVGEWVGAGMASGVTHDGAHGAHGAHQRRAADQRAVADLTSMNTPPQKAKKPAI
jgi:hypothetical protein